MPIYEYSCEDCQHVFEEWQKDFTDREMACPVCGGRAKRMISNTSFILKGSGWYVTDYAKGSSSSGNGGNGNGGSKTESTDSSSSDKSSADGASSTPSKSSEGTTTSTSSTSQAS